jgi:hypothetical protein
MTMSRLFLIAFAVGLLVAPTAMADVPNCNCLDDYDATWPSSAENCLFACPGAWLRTGHTPGAVADNQIRLYRDDLCTDPLVGFDCLRIDLSEIYPDSICVCDEECVDFPYIYPEGPTDATGTTQFRFRGSILQLEEWPTRETPPASYVDIAWLQVCGCQDRPVRFRGPDVDASCNVALADFVIFSAAFILGDPGNPNTQPSGYQHYTIYDPGTHCAPMPKPALSDFVIFSPHFGDPANSDLPHACTPGACDP